MASVPQIIKSRHKRRRKQNQNFTHRLKQLSLGILAIVGLVVCISVLSVSVQYANLIRDIPSPDLLVIYFESLKDQPHNPTKLFDRSGKNLIAVLENPTARQKKYFSIGPGDNYIFPEALISATTTSIEPGFWQNPGITWDAVRGNNKPTIAQLLVRNYLLEEDIFSNRRKLQELLLAAQVISLYGHDQSLEWYLNSAYFGNLAYGADAAARIYFGKSVSDLDYLESAMLAAAAKSPQVNPIDAPIEARRAADQILQDMFEQGLISLQDLEESQEADLRISNAKDISINLEPAFTDLVIDQVSDYIPADKLFRGGFSIITTLDFELQSQTLCTAEELIARTQGKSTELQSQSAIEACEMARLLPYISEEDLLENPPISVNALIMEPGEGQVLAMIGEHLGYQDPLPFSGHPPGTILTPFIYLSSFTRGSNPATLIWDIPANFPPGIQFETQEMDQFKGPVSLRTALANDYLVPALQVLDRMDPKLVWQTVENLGLTRLQLPPENGEYQIILQGGSANLVEVGQAYGVLANQGILTGIARSNGSGENSNSPIVPQVVLKVLDDSGNERLNCSDQLSSCRVAQRPVISQDLSYLITDILSDETARWPSLGHPNFLEIGHPAAAKIGMTSNQDSLWTLGYTPDLLTAVWVGPRITDHDDPISPDLSAGLWHAIMQYATKDSPGREFPVPESINELSVCYPSGLLPTEDCPHIVNEIFISGSEPTQADNLYQSFLVNQESGLLATIFTPPALIEEQVFMTIPPEAQEWADEAGILQAPTDYELIGASSNKTSEVQITSPTMFSTINGSVPVIGSATGEGFQSYRLQYGSGLNPVAWFQLGGQVDDSIQSGKLGTWDTQGMSGLYVLQLIVTYGDDRVETSIIQVRIDNQDPEIRILYPEDKQIFKQDESETITLQVEASDDLGLNRVEFYIDSELSATLNSPPFVLPWRVDIGEHFFKVIAYDQAGNKADADVRISVE